MVTCLLAGAGIEGGHAQGGTPTATTLRGPNGQDQAMSTLLADLDSKGLLDQTVVVLGTEFGRTSRINDNDGRDPNTIAFRCLLAVSRRGHPQRRLRGDGTSGRGPGSGDDRPARRPPVQGAAGPDAGGSGHRMWPHATDQRQGRAGPPSTATTSRGPWKAAVLDQSMSCLLADLRPATARFRPRRPRCNGARAGRPRRSDCVASAGSGMLPRRG